jgi:hypothetical protein
MILRKQKHIPEFFTTYDKAFLFFIKDAQSGVSGTDEIKEAIFTF